jgi:S-adenosylmethionine:tRNA-ribosyltransferase-isomerase (queuine synthetase)
LSLADAVRASDVIILDGSMIWGKRLMESSNDTEQNVTVLQLSSSPEQSFEALQQAVIDAKQTR